MTPFELTDGDAAATVVPERGGLVTRFAVGARELLYLDPATLADPTKNVRGGVPVLFPFAGRPPPGSDEPRRRRDEPSARRFAPAARVV